MEACVSVTNVVKATVSAHQAYIMVTVSTRLDSGSRQSECWANGLCGVVRPESGDGVREEAGLLRGWRLRGDPAGGTLR